METVPALVKSNEGYLDVKVTWEPSWLIQVESLALSEDYSLIIR